MNVNVAYTEYGVPHITGTNWWSLGYGAGYSHADQHGGMLVDRWLTLRAARSRHYGPDGTLSFGPNRETTNRQSDLWWQKIRSDGIVQRAWGDSSDLGVIPPVRELISGYVAGYNAYLDVSGNSSKAVWTGHIDETDVLLQALHWNTFRSSTAFIPNFFTLPPEVHAAGKRDMPAFSPPPHESNMAMFGSEATWNGRGIMLANPHWYWRGPDSFREIHLRVPGELDIYGSCVPGLPFVMSGFTTAFAYAGTSSFSPRFSLYRLELCGDGRSYRYDGSEHQLEEQHVCVDAGEYGTLEQTFWASRHGTILGGEQYRWTGTTAFAFRDVAMSVRWLNQQFCTMAAKSIEDVDSATRRFMAVGWRNLMCVDAEGRVFYADRTAVPHLTDEQLDHAEAAPGDGDNWSEATPIILDGSTPETDWGNDPDAPVPGIFGSSSLPTLWRRDYLANQNDTHWLNNARHPLEGYPRVLGPERTPRTLRTRFALTRIEEALRRKREGEDPGLSFREAHAALFDSTVWSAVLWRDEVVERARQSQDRMCQLAADVLADWNLREDAAGRGAWLWRRFFFTIAEDNERITASLFASDFDSSSPISTPAGLAGDVPVLAALRRAVKDLMVHGIPLTSTVPERQGLLVDGEWIPVPGGPGAPGQYNLVRQALREGGEATTEIDYGTGFVLWVEFTDDGPVARSVLTYSQSDDPSSEHFADQTRLYSSGQYKPVRFHAEEVADNAISFDVLLQDAGAPAEHVSG